MKLAFVFLASLLPMLAFGHGNTIDAVRDSSVEVLNMFKSTEADSVKSAFRGVKAWPKGDTILAKVYYMSGGKEVSLDYACKMDHANGNDKMVCQKQ